jgi:hypothetical protein
VDEQNILGSISDMIAKEHEIRQQLGSGKVTESQAQQQLSTLEVSLDQCWDLLRQRRARREFAQDPDQAAVRPTSVVEEYES